MWTNFWKTVSERWHGRHARDLLASAADVSAPYGASCAALDSVRQDALVQRYGMRAALYELVRLRRAHINQPR
jgi:hypothetical protein